MSSDDEQVNPFDVACVKLTLIYVMLFTIVLAAFGFIWFFWRDYMLISTDTIFASTKPLGEALASVWWMFCLWPFAAFIISAIYYKIVPQKNVVPDTDLPPGLIVLKGIYLSANAGFFEELIYRWLVFLSAMPIAVFFNWITFGFYKWLMVTILLPLANWATLGTLSPQLLGSEWTIGAAVIMANAHFRDGHKGLIAHINTWLLGMVLFWLMFNYGIWAAIAAHFIYDCIAFTLYAVEMAIKRRRRKNSYYYRHSFY